MDVREAAGRIADAFEVGLAPWSRSHRHGSTCRLPVDARSGLPFRGVDAWLLELAAIRGKYRSSQWATAREWAEIGAVVVRQGGTGVVDRTRPDDPGEGEGLVYNLEQVEVSSPSPVTSLDHLRVAGEAMPDYRMAERVLHASGARVVEDECCRCVVSRLDDDRDFIGMSPLDSFGGDLDRYWSAMFHELTHWVHLRCRRGRWVPDPSPAELIAMFGSAILTTRCGIPMCGHLDPDCDDVRAWITGIRRHHGYLTSALNVAELAADLLLCQAGCGA